MKKYKRKFVEYDIEKSLLFKSDWFAIYQTDDGYEFLEFPDGTAILPYKIENNNKYYLLRNEKNPLNETGYITTVITGRRDTGETYSTCAVRELYEESGYIVEEDELIDLGFVKFGKATNTKESLFCVDITFSMKDNVSGIGVYEQASSNFWVSEEELKDIIARTDDAYLLSIYSKIKG